VGDYNQDRRVDAGDYAVWRKNLGAAGLPNRDPAKTGPIGEEDYNAWRAHYGQTLAGAGAGSTSAQTSPAPEPAGAALFMTACTAAALRRCCIRRHMCRFTTRGTRR
jgi:hypothetical protein